MYYANKFDIRSWLLEVVDLSEDSRSKIQYEIYVTQKLCTTVTLGRKMSSGKTTYSLVKRYQGIKTHAWMESFQAQ